MHTADAITNLDNRHSTLTAGGGGLSESYESYESYESVGAPLIYALVLSQRHSTLAPFHCKTLQTLGLSHGAIVRLV